MSSMPEYVFSRDFLDNNRINLQHHLWVEIFGYHLHSDIPLEGSKLRIADIGTGTGIWLTAMSTRLPDSVTLDGLDVSFDALPPAPWLPPNMNLRKWNVKEAIPDGLAEAYDIVHIRNFAFVLDSNDIPGVLENLIKLLKPGGYLQWGETDISSFRVRTASPENGRDALYRLFKLTENLDPRLSPRWAAILPTQFLERGLENVKCDSRNAAPHLALAMHECNLMMQELMAQTTGNEKVSREIRELMSDVVHQTRQGATWDFTRLIVIGKKPDSA